MCGYSAPGLQMTRQTTNSAQGAIIYSVKEPRIVGATWYTPFLFFYFKSSGVWYQLGLPLKIILIIDYSANYSFN